MILIGKSMKFLKILKNDKNRENFKNGFRGNFKNKSFELCIEEQKSFTIHPPKINISNSRTDFHFSNLIKFHENRGNTRKL